MAAADATVDAPVMAAVVELVLLLFADELPAATDPKAFKLLHACFECQSLAKTLLVYKVAHLAWLSIRPEYDTIRTNAIARR